MGVHISIDPDAEMMVPFGAVSAALGALPPQGEEILVGRLLDAAAPHIVQAAARRTLRTAAEVIKEQHDGIRHAERSPKSWSQGCLKDSEEFCCDLNRAYWVIVDMAWELEYDTP